MNDLGVTSLEKGGFFSVLFPNRFDRGLIQYFPNKNHKKTSMKTHRGRIG